MRIFLLNSVCGTGSTGKIVTDIAEILLNKGHDVKIAYGIGENKNIDSKHTVKINNKAGYYIHNILSKITDRAGFYSINATNKLIREIEEFKPDLINLHNLHGYYVNVKKLFQYLKKIDIPVVWTLHDCWAITGHCTHFSFINCDRWKEKCKNCPQKKEYPVSLLLDCSSKNYADKKELFTGINNMTIITPSEWLAQIVSNSYLNKYPIFTIPNGIDMEIYRNIPGNFRDNYNLTDKKIILAVANVWSLKKGMYDVFKLSDKLDSSKYQIVMVGLSKKQMKIVPSSIIAIERTSSVDELVNIYSEADIFINLSYEETMGMVTVEALACNTPCIVYDRTAVPEVIDKECGLVVRAGDIDELYSAIKKIKYKKMDGCIKKAEKYEKNKQYQKYLNLYFYLYNTRG